MGDGIAERLARVFATLLHRSLCRCLSRCSLRSPKPGDLRADREVRLKAHVTSRCSATLCTSGRTVACPSTLICARPQARTRPRADASIQSRVHVHSSGACALVRSMWQQQCRPASGATLASSRQMANAGAFPTLLFARRPSTANGADRTSRRTR
eukprot:5633260-Pleurochrysis_carterae.AAC.2